MLMVCINLQCILKVNELNKTKSCLASKRYMSIYLCRVSFTHHFKRGMSGFKGSEFFEALRYINVSWRNWHNREQLCIWQMTDIRNLLHGNQVLAAFSLVFGLCKVNFATDHSISDKFKDYWTVEYDTQCYIWPGVAWEFFWLLLYKYTTNKPTHSSGY